MSRKKDYKIRLQACRLAAKCFYPEEETGAYTPMMWSLAVFFEMYLRQGSHGTMRNFGPKKPKRLKVVK